jgi:predicted PurR-regulated permease PerM
MSGACTGPPESRQGRSYIAPGGLCAFSPFPPALDNSRIGGHVTDSAGGKNPPNFFARVVLAVGIVAAALGLVLILWFEIHTLMLAFMGLLLAVFLYTLADWLARFTKMPYWLSLTIVCLVLIGLLFGVGYLSGERIGQQAAALREELPKAWNKLRAWLEARTWGAWLLERGSSISSHATHGTSSELITRGVGVFTTTTQTIADAFVILFVGLFGAINRDVYVRGTVRLVPLRHRARAREVMQACGRILWWWLVGQLIAMVFIGIITGLTLWLLGVPLAMTLGVIAALLNFIPNVGPILSAVPAAMLGMLHTPMTAVWVLLAYFIIQMLQDHVVTPVVQQETVRLPPVILILAQVFMYYWAGILGLILAPALAAVLLKIVQMLYVHQTLGDDMRDAAEEEKRHEFWPVGAKTS